MVAKKHGFAFLSAACLLFASCTLVHAQQPHTLKYSLDATPKNILVLRGTNLEFSGPISIPGEHPFYMQCNGQVVEANSFREQWTLHFDTRTAKADYTTLTLHTGNPNGGNRLLARLHISITDKIPFAISQESFRPEPVDAMQLRLSTLTDHKPQRVELTLDGHTLPAELDTKGIISFEATEERLGGHVLGGRVIMDDDQTFELNPIGIEVIGRVRLLPFPFGNALDYSALVSGKSM